MDSKPKGKQKTTMTTATKRKSPPGSGPSTNQKPKKKAKTSTSQNGTSKSASFPSKISKALTIAQLRQEAEQRGFELGNAVKITKDHLLEILGDGSASLVALHNDKNGKSANAASSKPNTTTKKTASKAPSNKTTSSKAAKSSSKSPAKKTIQSKITSVLSPAKKSDTKHVKPTPKPHVTKSSNAAGVSVKPTAKAAPPQPKKSSSTVTAKQTTVKPTKKEAPKKSTSPKASPPISSSSTSAASKSSPVTTDYPRIHGKMTLVKLKEEVVARNLDIKKVPKTKADLLHYLVDGSIHVSETDEYKTYLQLLGKIQQERPRLMAASQKKFDEANAKREAKMEARWAKEKEERQRQELQREQLRQDEITRQKSLHVHSLPRLHCHKLAKTCQLKFRGEGRYPTCSECHGRDRFTGRMFINFDSVEDEMLYTCEQCDLDICKECVGWKSKSKQEQNKITEQRRKQRQAEEEEAERRAEEERMRWDASKQFKKATLEVRNKNKSPSSPLKFTVWCSDGYDHDGWHSYEGAPDQDFDSSWNTKKEANDRARYLFSWKNPWGLEPDEIGDDYHGNIESPESVRDGMNTLVVAPPDSTRWTVGVVPAAAYPHLPNATNRRHSHDEDRRSDSEAYFVL